MDGAVKIYPSHTPYGFTLQNPIGHHEIDGNIIETGWDVFNLALDVASLGANLATGNYADAALDAGGLLYDAAATLVPGLPGGAGTAIKASRAGKAAIKVVNKTKVVLSTADRLNIISKSKFVKEASGLWSKTNYRRNLQKATGKLADGFDAHHTLPKNKAFADFFEKAGLDVNDPANLVWRDAKQHRGTNSAEHTKLWTQFMKDKPKATKAEILKQRDIIEKKVFGNTKGDLPKQ